MHLESLVEKNKFKLSQAYFSTLFKKKNINKINSIGLAVLRELFIIIRESSVKSQQDLVLRIFL